MTIHKNSEKTDNPSRTYTDYLKLLQPHSRLSMTMCASRLILAWKRFAVTLPRLQLLKRLSTWVSKQCVATPLQEPFFFSFFFSPLFLLFVCRTLILKSYSIISCLIRHSSYDALQLCCVFIRQFYLISICISTFSTFFICIMYAF